MDLADSNEIPAYLLNVKWSDMGLGHPVIHCGIEHENIEEAGQCFMCWWAGHTLRRAHNRAVKYNTSITEEDGVSWSWRECLPVGHVMKRT